MEKDELLLKLKEEFEKLNKLSDKQFEQRFTTSKFENSWYDELFKDYQVARARIELLLEILT